MVVSSLLDGAATRGPGRRDEPGAVLSIPWRVLPPDKSTATKQYPGTEHDQYKLELYASLCLQFNGRNE